jgi:hypothetical protein
LIREQRHLSRERGLRDLARREEICRSPVFSANIPCPSKTPQDDGEDQGVEDTADDHDQPQPVAA